MFGFQIYSLGRLPKLSSCSFSVSNDVIDFISLHLNMLYGFVKLHCNSERYLHLYTDKDWEKDAHRHLTHKTTSPSLFISGHL